MLQFSKRQYKQTPFLSIITRVYKRPKGLSANMASIESLQDKDVEQIFITDPIGVGLLEANRSFAKNETKSLIDGQYVYLLDDDDFIVNPKMINELKDIAQKFKPDVICFRMVIKNNMNGNYYPTDEKCWGVRPVIARIGGSCFVVKRQVWLKHIHEFGVPRCGDFYFIDSIFNAGHSFYWHNVLMAETSKVSRGKPE